MALGTHENFAEYVCSQFSDLEQGNARRKCTPRKQLAMFIATMQLLVNYSWAKENRRML